MYLVVEAAHGVAVFVQIIVAVVWLFFSRVVPLFAGDTGLVCCEAECAAECLSVELSVYAGGHTGDVCAMEAGSTLVTFC